MFISCNLLTNRRTETNTDEVMNVTETGESVRDITEENAPVSVTDNNNIKFETKTDSSTNNQTTHENTNVPEANRTDSTKSYGTAVAEERPVFTMELQTKDADVVRTYSEDASERALDVEADKGKTTEKSDRDDTIADPEKSNSDNPAVSAKPTNNRDASGDNELSDSTVSQVEKDNKDTVRPASPSNPEIREVEKDNTDDPAVTKLTEKEKMLKDLLAALGIAEGNLDEVKAAQLLALVEENDALSAYTSAKAAVITAKEDLDRFVKEHEAAVEEEESYNKILDAKTAVLSAAMAEYNEVVEKNALVSDYTNALGAFNTAAEELETTLAAKAEAETAAKAAAEEYQSAIDAKTSADFALMTASEKKDSADRELKDAQAAKDKAVAALVSAKGNNDEAQKALQEANAAIATAQGKVDTAKDNLEAAKEASVVTGVSVIDAQKAYDDACAALQEAQNVIGQGSLGFFNANAGSEDNAAAEVLNYVFEMQREGINKGMKYQGKEFEFTEHMYTNLGAEDDATSLDNVRHAIDLMKELNEIRVNEGLEPLKVTDAMMAIGEVQANIEYGLNVDYEVFTHNKGIISKYGVGENLAPFDEGETRPFDAWYYDEKAVSDYMKEHNMTNAYEAYEKLHDEGFDFRGYYITSTGHYRNIINDFYITTGMGVRTSSDEDPDTRYQPSIATNNFSSWYDEENEKAYTVEEYEAMFNEYCNTVNKNATDAQAAVDKAKADLDAALNGEQDAVDSAKKLAEAETAYNNAVKELETAQATAEVKQEAADEAQVALDEATTANNEATETLQEAEAVAEAATVEYNDAKETSNAADEAVETAETAKVEAEETLEAAETAAAEKQEAADTAKADLEKASEDIADMSEEEIENARQIVEDAQTAVETAQVDVDDATQDFEEARKKSEDAERNVENGKMVYDAAVAAEAEKGKEYDDAVAALEAATAEVESAQAEVDEINSNIETVTATGNTEAPEVHEEVEANIVQADNKKFMYDQEVPVEIDNQPHDEPETVEAEADQSADTVLTSESKEDTTNYDFIGNSEVLPSMKSDAVTEILVETPIFYISETEYNAEADYADN